MWRRTIFLLGILAWWGGTARGAAVQKKNLSKGDLFVAKCRKHCIAKLTLEASQDSCLEKEECLRCWASCAAFQRDSYIREYCKPHKACTAGCRLACRFYLTSSSDPPVTSVTSTSGQRAQVTPQTALVSPDESEETLGITPGPVSQGDEVKRTDSMRSSKRLESKLQDSKDRWTVRLDRLQFSAPLVSATVSWPSQGQDAQYLVTWELRSGGLRGHMVSEDTSAVLSLWPNEDYLVQIFSGGVSSEVLLVSTEKSEPSPVVQQSSISFVMTGVILLLLLLVLTSVAFLVRRDHLRRRRSEKLIPEHAENKAWKSSALVTTKKILRIPEDVLAESRRSPVFVISPTAR